MRDRRAAGYTLLELMIVVAVIGVLSAIAIPSYRGYMQRAKASEAITFLGEIRQRQEAYRAEFGQYCNASGSNASDAIASGTWNPSSMPSGGNRAAFDESADNWDQLGAAPDTLVLFQFRTTAGSPGVNSGVPNLGTTEFWFAAQARGDLDADSELVIFEVQSATTQVFIGDGSMNPLPQGWD